MLEEIITQYKPDGINLDYIRYPQALAATFPSHDLSNWGYTNFARAEFKQTYKNIKNELKNYKNDNTYTLNKLNLFLHL